MSRTPASERGSKGQKFLLVFMLVWTSFTGFLAFHFAATPLQKMYESRSWPPTPCVITHSEVLSERDSDGDRMLRLDVRFTYQMNGHAFPGDQYSFWRGRSNLSRWRAEVVRDNPVGSTRTCYVNPENVAEAVLNRGWVQDCWLMLIPFGMFGVGLAVLSGILLKRKAKPGGPASESARSTYSLVPTTPTEELTSRSGGKRIAVVVVLFFIWAAWTGGFVAIVRSDAPRIIHVIFGAVDLALLGALGYHFLALFNPALTLSVRPGSPLLGGKLQCSWQLEGGSRQPTSIEITIEGREETTYRRGTTTYTDRHTFFTHPLFESSEPEKIRSGTVEWEIPAHLMHSFRASNNKVVWEIKLRAPIPKWPDLQDRLPIQVRASSV